MKVWPRLRRPPRLVNGGPVAQIAGVPIPRMIGFAEPMAVNGMTARPSRGRPFSLAGSFRRWRHFVALPILQIVTEFFRRLTIIVMSASGK